MGRTIIGFVADRIGPVNALFFVIMMSGLSQLLVWTFVSTYGGIVSHPCPSSLLSIILYSPIVP